MCCHGDDADEKDPYHDKMDWTAWRVGHSYQEPAKKDWRKACRDPNYVPTNNRRYKIKELIWERPNISIEEIAEALDAPRTSHFSIACIANEYRHSLRFLVRQGIEGIELGKRRQRVRKV